MQSRRVLLWMMRRWRGRAGGRTPERPAHPGRGPAAAVRAPLGSARVSRLGSWDRGFAGTPWPDEVLARHLRFVLRWPGRYQLLGARGGWQTTKARQLVRGRRSWNSRLLWDARHHCERRTGVLAVPVWRADDRPLPIPSANVRDASCRCYC